MSALRTAARSLDRGSLAEAEALCRRVLEAHPDSVDALHLLALVRRRSGDARDAEALLRRCLELVPARAEIHANLGNLLAAASRLHDARCAYRQALTIDPGFRPARLGLARALNRSGDFDAARREGQALTDRDGRDAEAWTVVATAARGQRRADDAEAAWRNALACRPGYGFARHGLGALLSESGRSEEALAELELAGAAGIEGPDLDFHRAGALMALYRFDEAERLLEESIRAAPRQVAAHRLLARIRFMRGGADFADRFASAVLDHPADVMLRIGCAQTLRGAGRLKDARAVLEQGLPAAGDPRLLVELAAVEQEACDFTSALRAARAALALAPGDRSAREALIDALLSLGRAAEALPVIEALRHAAPLNQWYVAMEATAARLLGDARHGLYCDYAELVRVFDLPPPPGWPDIEAFHRELVPVLLERHRFRAPPLDQSLRHGTQTPRNLLGDPHPLIRAFLRALEKPIADYREAIGFAPDHPFKARNEGGTTLTGCWSVLLGRGGFHVNHVHTEGWISSAYYVEVPDEAASGSGAARSGWLRFGEPRFPAPGAHAEKWVRPRAGRLVLFPSYLWHGTTPLTEGDRRLTIAFDAVPRPPR